MKVKRLSAGPPSGERLVPLLTFDKGFPIRPLRPLNADRSVVVEISPSHSKCLRAGVLSEMAFYEKVIKVKADVAALLIVFLVLCGFRHIFAENFALGSLRSDDWQLGRPTAPPLLSVFRVFSPPNASSLPCCIDPVVTWGAVKGAPEKGAFILTLDSSPRH